MYSVMNFSYALNKTFSIFLPRTHPYSHTHTPALSHSHTHTYTHTLSLSLAFLLPISFNSRTPRPGEAGFVIRARVPQSSAITFSVRPKSLVEEVEDKAPVSV